MIQRALSLLLVAVMLVAGCVGGPGQTPTDTDTAVPTATESPTTDDPTPDENATVEWPEGPKSRPERPANLTTERVREFVKTHEYRYVYNSLWYGQHTNVTLDCSVDKVGPAGEGYEAIVSCTGYSNTRGPIQGTRTATEVHADWFTQTYVYYVDEDSLRRTRADE